LNTLNDESLSVVGASGSGKTTLIMLMCGIMAPSTGLIRWSGEPIATPQQWTDLRRSEIGIGVPGLQSVADFVL
jgi:putative ABC transport system ATP-binding protein